VRRNGIQIGRGQTLLLLNALEIDRRRVATDGDVGELGQRRLVDDRVEHLRLDTLFLAPRLRKHVMDVDVVVEEGHQVRRASADEVPATVQHQQRVQAFVSRGLARAQRSQPDALEHRLFQ
jgi:hypothetical protein